MSGVARGAHDGRDLSRSLSMTRAPAHCRRGATPCTPPTHPCRRPVHAHRHRCERTVPGCCANADSVRWCDRRDAWNTSRKTPMAEPACSPRSRHGTRPVTFADAPAPPSAHELFARRMQDLPRLPSRAALLALTEHDLPNIDDLPTPDSMYQDKVTYYTVLALKRALRHHRAYTWGVAPSSMTLGVRAKMAGSRRCGSCPMPSSRSEWGATNDRRMQCGRRASHRSS